MRQVRVVLLSQLVDNVDVFLSITIVAVSCQLLYLYHTVSNIYDAAFVRRNKRLIYDNVL